MDKSRRYLSPEQKAAILREHLIDKVPVSDLCDKHGLQPTAFYHWQKEAFKNLPSLFERKGDAKVVSLRRENEWQASLLAALRVKLSHKDEVIAEIMEDLVAAKKTLGGPR